MTPYDETLPNVEIAFKKRTIKKHIWRGSKQTWIDTIKNCGNRKNMLM